MTKSELKTRLKLADEANKEAFKILRGVMYALREHNFGTAEARCSNGIQKLNDVLDTNMELLGEK